MSVLVLGSILLSGLVRETDICFMPFCPLRCPLDPHVWAGYLDEFKIEMLEMQVEARLIRRTQDLGTRRGDISVHLGENGDLKSKSAKITAEFKSWARLFGEKFIDRTWIGVLMMVFQRTCG